MTVDDDSLLRRSLTFTLQQAGYRVSDAGSAEDALAKLDTDPADLLLLDIGLPGMDGLDALQEVRRRTDAPVIFLTPRRRELEQVLGLELGADDYVTKPFDSTVLLARIKAVLRRYHPAINRQTVADGELQIGDLSMHPAAHKVEIDGRELDLSRREFDLLYALVCSAGNILTADELLDNVWGEEFVGEPQVLYVHMRRLREKVEADAGKPTRIVTVRGVGYKFVPPRRQFGLIRIPALCIRYAVASSLATLSRY